MSPQNPVIIHQPPRNEATPQSPVSRNCRWLAYAYLASVPFEIDFVLAGRSVSFWLALALVGMVTVEWGSGSERRRGTRVNGRLVSASLVLLVYAFLSYFWSFDPAATFASAMIFAMTIATWIAVAITISGYILQAFRALVLGTSVMSIVALTTESNIDGRADLAANANDVAALMAIASGYLVSEVVGRDVPTSRRLASLGLLGLNLVGLLATGSRTGVLAVLLAATALFLTYMARARLRALALVSLMVLTLSGIALLMGVTIPDRVAAIPEAVSAGDLSSREVYWEIAAAELPSVAGIGFGASPSWLGSQLGKNDVVHSVYLGIALELGVIGVLLWGRLVWLLIQTARNIPQSLHLLTAATAIAVMASTLTLETRRPLWVLLALMSAGGIILSKRDKVA